MFAQRMPKNLIISEVNQAKPLDSTMELNNNGLNFLGQQDMDIIYWLAEFSDFSPFKNIGTLINNKLWNSKDNL